MLDAAAILSFAAGLADARGSGRVGPFDLAQSVPPAPTAIEAAGQPPELGGGL